MVSAGGPRGRSLTGASLTLGSLVLTLVVSPGPAASIGPAATHVAPANVSPANITHLEPYAWGSVQTGSSAHLSWSSPVVGDGTLSTTRPSGGGTLGAAIDTDGPTSKLGDLIAFDGGEVIAFAEGSAASSATAHMIAVVESGSGSGAHELWAWGNNTYGQLGIGTRTASQTPRRVSWTPAAGEQVVAVEVGEGHSLMLTDTAGVRTVYAWGRNNVGQLGIAAVAMSSSGVQTTPRVVPSLDGEGIVDIAAGRFHSAAIDDDGYAWVWGYDAATNTTSYGDLGVSGTKPRPVPVRLTDDTLLTRRVTPTSYSITNNVVTVTTGDRNFFDAGNTVATTGSGIDIVDQNATLTKVTATSYSHIAQPNVASTAANGTIALTTTTATPSAASITSNTARLTVATGHDIRVGNRVRIAIGDPAFDGDRIVTGRGGTYIDVTSQPDVATTAAPSGSTAAHTATDPVAVTSRALTNNIVSLTVTAGHPFKAGSRITVTTGDPTVDGSHTITALQGSTIIKYAVTAADIAPTATTGTVTLDDPTITITDYSITGNTATVTADPTGPSHNFRPGNTLTITGLGGNLEGPTTITGVTGTTFSFVAEENRASTPVTGTIDILDTTDTVTAYSITANTAELTITSGHTFEVGNQILVAGIGGLDGNLDGITTITAVTATGVRFQAQPNVPATAITSGTPEAVVTDCTSSCPSAPTGLVEIAAGAGFTMARTTAGGVITWGYTHTNTYGRLGRSGDNRPAAVTLPSGCLAAQLDASPFNGAVVCDGATTVATWGNNAHLQLGTNVTTSSVATPALVSGLSLAVGETIVDIDADTAGMTVLTSTGRVLAWGRGSYLRIGTSSTTNQKTAQVATRIDPPTGETPRALFSTYFTSGIADTAGVAWTWGYGGGAGLQAQGVTGPTTSLFARVGIDPSTRIDRIDTTYYATVALLSDGSMWSWGTKASTSGTYFLGDATGGSRLLPGRITLPVGLDTALAAHTVTGLDCSYTHCLVTTSNGSIYGWGDGRYKALTLNSTADRSSPTLIRSGLTAPVVAAGNGYSLFVDTGATGSGGTLHAWGLNTYRRASPSTSSTSLTALNEVKDMSVPASPGSVNDVIAVAAGNTHTIALRANGTLMAWGRNNVGQLAIGSTASTTYYSEPVLPGGRTAASLHAEGDHVLVRATDGTLHGWGRNTNGVLGTGGVSNVLTPTHVAVDHTFTRIDTSGHPSVKHVQSTVGLTGDGTVLAWGANSYGQLGRPDRAATSNGYSATPVVVQTTDGADLPGGVGVEPLDAVVAGGAWSAAFHRATTDLPPSEPLSVSASSPASGTIDISWTAPASPRRLLGYMVTVSRGGSVVFTAGAGASATSVSLTTPTVDIIDGEAHTITVSAVNDAGTSSPSTAVTATPTGLPSEAQNLAIDVVADGFDISFDTPLVDGGLAILDHTVTATPISCGTIETLTVAAGTDPRTGAMRTGAGGLVAGCEYTVSVVARNANGSGPAVTSGIVVPGRPAAPTVTAAIGLVTAAEITFTPPADDGGAPILSHVITAYDTGTTTVAGSIVVSAGATTGTVTGLTDGNVYDIVVRASQSADGLTLLGSPSTAEPVTAGRPIAPNGVTASPTSTRTVSLSWNPVADVAGITVTGYETRTTIGATVGAAVSRTCGSTPCSVAIGSLTNGTPTTFEVRAVAAGGVGPWSTAVTTTPRTVPAAPAALELSPSDGTASIGFEPPSDTGGDDLDAYIVTVTPTAGGAPVWSGTLAAIDTFAAVEDLANGTSYTVSVQARNRAGLSPASTGTVTPATVPGAPTGVRVRPGSIIVQWEAPTDDGGDAVDTYEITLTDTDGISTTVETSGSASCSTASRTCTITQVFTSASPETLTAIPSDMEYSVSVAAVNGQGAGTPASEALIVSAQPSEPVAPSSSPSIGAVSLCWSPPSTVPSGRSVTAYRLRFDDGTGPRDVTVVVADLAPDAGCTAPSVGHVVSVFDDGSSPVAGTTYTVTIAASTSTDDFVFGIESATMTVTPYDIPGSPPSVSVVTTGTTALVSWVAAADNGESVDGYTVTADPGGATCTWVSGPLECTIVGLADGVDHAFAVVATNAAGDGPVGRSAAVRVDATGPSAAWSELGRDDTTTARVRLTFDEPVTGFAVDDVTGVTGCMVTLGTVTGTTADLTLACPDGDVTPVLAAGSVSDTAGNPGPSSAVSGPVLTFSTPVVTTPVSTAPPSTPVITSPGTTVPAVAAPEVTTTTSVGVSGDDGGAIGFGPEGGGGDGVPLVMELPATGSDARSGVTRALWVIVFGFGLVLLTRRRTMCSRARCARHHARGESLEASTAD